MKLLIVDTSTSVFSLAVTAGERILAQETGAAGHATAGRLGPAVEKVMLGSGIAVAELDGFAVTVGPGAFTGIRVGISLVKGLAYSTGKPVAMLSSLELLAMNVVDSSLPVCPMFDARKGEVYAALFHAGGGMNLLPEMAIDPGALLEKISGPALFLGDGALRYRSIIAGQLGRRALFAEPGLDQPLASAGVRLALREFASGSDVSSAEILPRYLRLSEAELSRRP
jgi:tRNA threonylcarbamoyladenosine biosynthesis protein TsaB